MKTSFQFACLIFLLPIQKSAGSSCAFTGACLYNINVHHCDKHIKRSLTGSDQRLCPCSDVTTLQNQHQNLSSWVGTINTTFQHVRAELVGLKEELKEKSTELVAINFRNKQDNATLQRYNKEILTTEIAISNERQIWFKERDRLQNELHRIITESQVCQQVTTTSSSSHQGSASDASIVLFCDFETSGQCGFQQDHSDDLDWSYGHGTQSSSTGPKEDHTYGNPHGHYMFLDAYNHASRHSSSTTSTTRLISSELPASRGYCVMFWYNLHGADVKTFHVYAKIHGGLGNPVFSHTGNLDQDWHLAKVYLDSEYTTSPLSLVFEAKTDSHKTYHYSSGYSYYHRYGNIAIDDVYVFNSSCKSIPKHPSGSHPRVSINSTSYYTFHSTPSSWFEAQTACKKESPYSHLVSVRSREEQEYIVNVIKSTEDLTAAANTGFFTSGSDDRAEGIFEWTDTGTPYPVTYSNWQPGQPNNVGSNQDCLLLQYPDNDWTWGDVDCAEKHPFICEVKQTI
ncbi:MAM and LDL-receptor class A domain-containing protein 1-like [Crassostrea angulata]|uniref:MAM and LDL-receptor class A domain-containing protein 1-like n=1 Tax=Magallana angulata TaxID=2784310 RepID=UPI0022B0FD6D|nr:MAM and LDL-receptor class A domain-containing protein 1-like [Crassostrea angulata]